MADQTTYLGWDSPPLNLLQEWLAKRFTVGSLLDLSNVTIVLPTANAIRQLQQGLTRSSNNKGFAFLPPEMTTIGGLPETLYPHKPPADTSFQQLAWYKAITETSRAGNLKDLLPHAPPLNNRLAWQHLADAVAKVHRELSGDGVAFADFVTHYETEGATHEAKRWQQLEQVQSVYFAILDEHQVWDLQNARVIALDHSEISAPIDRLFVVAGCSDLTKTIRGFLSEIAAQTEFIVFAPDSMRACFDNVGCLTPDAWDASIPSIPMSQIKIASDPNHQAELVLDTITGLSEHTTSSEILIAIPDAPDEKTIVRQLKRHDISVNTPTGTGLGDTKIPILISLINDYLPNQSFHALASLLRHPDIANRLIPGLDLSKVLTELTDYHEERLPLDDSGVSGSQQRYPLLSEATQQIQHWCEPLLSSQEDARQIHLALLDMLETIYGDLTLHRDTHRTEIKALSSITALSTELANACRQLKFTCTAEDFLSHLLTALAQSHVSAISIPGAISLSGWLDAPWSSQSTVIVTSLNEGIIPTASNTDLFIDDQTRQALGLLTNQRRLARDAYALALLQNSRDLTVICKKTNHQSDPLPISRLLLHGSVHQQANLIKQFSSGETSIAVHQIKRRIPKESLSPLEILVEPYQSDSISVTALRSFLFCPLRYYVGSVLQLKSADDSSRELSPLAFGNLIHNVLYEFGISAARDSVEETEIAAFLTETASRLFRRQYGRNTYPAARLQLEQIYHRLQAFAKWQSNWRSEGWTIIEAEYNASDPVIILDEFPECKIHGRIDRIDYNPQTATYAIFDYKTSESSDSPDKAHRSSNAPGWADLQLPMYRHLCRAITADKRVTLGYITLGKDLTSVGAQFANWDQPTLQHADKIAVDVIQAIRNGDFSNANPNVNFKFDNYAHLLGLTTLDHPGYITKENPL